MKNIIKVLSLTFTLFFLLLTSNTVQTYGETLIASNLTTLNLNESDYTSKSWEILQEELIKAKAIYNNEDASQKEIDNATDDLQVAIKNLELKPAKMNDLISLISKAEEKEKELYTSASWNQFQDDLNKAKIILDKNDSPQDVVDKATNNLEDSITSLEKKVTTNKDNLQETIESVDKNEVDDYYDNLGFFGKFFVGKILAPLFVITFFITYLIEFWND